MLDNRTTRPRRDKGQQLAFIDSQLRAGKPAAAVAREHQQRHRVSARQAREDVQQAQRSAADREIRDADANGAGFGLLLGRVRKLFRQSRERCDHSGAAAALRLEAELLGYLPGGRPHPEVIRRREKYRPKRPADAPAEPLT